MPNDNGFQATKTLKVNGGTNAPVMPLRTGLYTPPAPQRIPWRILVQISGESLVTIGMDLKETILVGRADPDASIFPDLDLTPYGGEKSGVSRQHARITLHEDALYIEDLGSTNSTRLNGYKLEPLNYYRLHDGDELVLGTLYMIVRLLRAPQ